MHSLLLKYLITHHNSDGKNPIMCVESEAERLRTHTLLQKPPLNKHIMFIQAKLILRSYKPLRLEKGMWFLGMQHKEMVVYELTYVPLDEDGYIQANGYPVEPYLYIEGNPNIPGDSFCIAEPDEIGWFDAGADSDELFDITLKQINNIIENGGHCDIEVDYQHLDDDEAQEDYINIEPVLFQGKVTIAYEDPYDDEGRFDDGEDDEDFIYDDEEDIFDNTQNNDYEDN